MSKARSIDPRFGKLGGDLPVNLAARDQAIRDLVDRIVYQHPTPTDADLIAAASDWLEGVAVTIRWAIRQNRRHGRALATMLDLYNRRFLAKLVTDWIIGHDLRQRAIDVAGEGEFQVVLKFAVRGGGSGFPTWQQIWNQSKARWEEVAAQSDVGQVQQNIYNETALTPVVGIFEAAP